MSDTPKDLKLHILAAIKSGAPAPTLAAQHGLETKIIWGWLDAEAARGVQRRPHFRRRTPQMVHPTNDDVVWFRELKEHRFRRSTDLFQLLPHRKKKKLQERLTTLYHSGWVDRPDSQREYFVPGARSAYVYALASKADDLLSHLAGEEGRDIDWRAKNRNAGRPYLHHQLLVGDVYAAFARCVQGRDDVELISREQILAKSPEATRRAPQPWKVRARLSIDGASQEMAVIPDDVFGLDFTGLRKRSYFRVEADNPRKRKAMPVWRTDIGQTSWRKKMLVYWNAHLAKQHTVAHNIPSCRVLTVTSSRERVASLVQAVQKVTDGKGAGLFLFIDADTFNNATDVLSLVWISGAGRSVRLID